MDTTVLISGVQQSDSFIYMCVCVRVYIYTRVFYIIYTHVGTHVHVCTYTHIHIICACYMYIHTHTHRLFSIVGYYKILNIVPCSISNSSLLIYFTYSSLCPLIQYSSFVPLPSLPHLETISLFPVDSVGFDAWLLRIKAVDVVLSNLDAFSASFSTCSTP